MKRQRFAAVMVLAATSLALGQQTPSSEEYLDFTFKPEAGKVTRHRLTSQTLGSFQMVGGMPAQKTSSAFDQDIVMKCTEVRDDGTSLWELTMPRMAMRSNTGGIKMQVDTARTTERVATQPSPLDEATNFVETFFRGMTAIKCKITFSKEGKPIDFSGFDENYDRLVAATKGKGLMGTIILKQLKAVLNDKSMLENFGSYQRMMPTKPRVRLGEEWTGDWEMTVPVINTRLKVHGTYRLDAVEAINGRRCARISTRQTFTTEPKERGETAAEAPSFFSRMSFTMNSEASDGNMWWDLDNREVVRVRDTQKMTLVMSMAADDKAAPDEAPQGFGKLTQHLTISTKLDLVEGEFPTPAPSTETLAADKPAKPAKSGAVAAKPVKRAVAITPATRPAKAKPAGAKPAAALVR